MVSFLQKKSVKVNYTNKGSHGVHWYGLLCECGEVELINRLQKAVTQGEQYLAAINTVIVTDSLLRAVAYNDTLITGFPYYKGLHYENFELLSITEWTHARNLEAIICAQHAIRRGLTFFATDYALNKSRYKEQKDHSINLMGLVYTLENVDIKEVNKNKNLGDMQFSDDFCCLMLYEVEMSDTIQFIGFVEHFQEYYMGEIEGLMMNV